MAHRVRGFFGATALFTGSYAASVYFTAQNRKTLESRDRTEEKSPQFKHLVESKIAKHLRTNKDFSEQLFYDAIPKSHRIDMLTSGILSGDGGLSCEPLIFKSKKNKQLVVVGHVGRQTAGHEKIVHGGVLATLLDEVLARCSFLSLPSGYGVTGQLRVDYLAPVPTDSYWVIRASTDEVKGRKVVVSADICLLDDDKPLVRGSAIMVEPKWAKYVTWLLN